MIKINGVSFNPKAVLQYKNADAFANHPGNNHLWSEIKPDARRERLKKIYDLVKQRLIIESDKPKELNIGNERTLVKNEGLELLKVIFGKGKEYLMQPNTEMYFNEPAQPVRPDTKPKKPRPASGNTRKSNSKKNASGGATDGANL